MFGYIVANTEGKHLQAGGRGCSLLKRRKRARGRGVCVVRKLSYAAGQQADRRGELAGDNRNGPFGDSAKVESSRAHFLRDVQE